MNGIKSHRAQKQKIALYDDEGNVKGWMSVETYKRRKEKRARRQREKIGRAQRRAQAR